MFLLKLVVATEFSPFWFTFCSISYSFFWLSPFKILKSIYMRPVAFSLPSMCWEWRWSSRYWGKLKYRLKEQVWDRLWNSSLTLWAHMHLLYSNESDVQRREGFSVVQLVRVLYPIRESRLTQQKCRSLCHSNSAGLAISQFLCSLRTECRECLHLQRREELMNRLDAGRDERRGSSVSYVNLWCAPFTFCFSAPRFWICSSVYILLNFNE